MENYTGYPHIDKPWEKFYDSDFLKKELPHMSIYEYMKCNTKNITDNIAMTYFGNKITYNELYENIDNASKVLTALGIKKDDRIMYLMPNIPETAYLMYGGAQIGAISDYVDPRPDSVDAKISAKKVLELIIEEKSKYIIALDQCYLAMIKPIENELREIGLENIIIVSASDSMNLLSNLNYVKEIAKFEGVTKLKEKLKRTKQIAEMVQEARNKSYIKIIDYKELIKNSRYTQFSPIDYEPNKIDLIVHTSGTSSPKPKPIPLTNDNLNAYAHQTFGANMTMEVGEKALHMLPYFAAFGVVDVVHAGFCHGNNLIQIPEFSSENFGKLIKKYKPQTIIGTPSWFLGLVKDKCLSDADLSFLKMITYGGDSMNIQDELKINEFLSQHGCKHKLTKGHGMSETCGCTSYAINEYNYPGTMGIPMPNTTYAIVDPDTKELLKFKDGEDILEGELIISSPSATPGVLDDRIIVPHRTYDNKDFIFTKDLATMNRDGVMCFQSRSDRGFTRYDGFKVKPHKIEEVLKKDNYIKECIVTPYFDEEKLGNMIKVTLALNEDVILNPKQQEDFVKYIINQYFINNPCVSTRQIPTKFSFKESLPLTLNGKTDYNALINEGITGEEITVKLVETNLSVDDIIILSPQKSNKVLTLKNTAKKKF